MRYVGLRNKNGRIEYVKAYKVNELVDELPRVRLIRGRITKSDEYYYLEDFATFDIESYTLRTDPPQGYMYIWQACIFGVCVYGRTWREFISLLNILETEYELDDHHRMVIYVHNLSYEFQFMRNFINKSYALTNVFATEKRKVLKAIFECFEFRCSYRLSNMSLAKFCETEKGRYVKGVGDLNYHKLRTPTTYLDDVEMSYCIADTIGLYYAIHSLMEHEQDTLATIPMTNTGYIRRYCRRGCRNNGHRGSTSVYRKIFMSCKIDSEVYGLLKECGRGGDTHANRWYSGQIIKDVDSYDSQSDYPAMMLLRKYPMSKFIEYGAIDDMNEFYSLLSSRACLFRLKLKNVRCKESFPSPYIPKSKCMVINGTFDNGRVLTADMLCITVTDIDYRIIEDCYEFDDLTIDKMMVANYGYLPTQLTNSVLHFFEQKTRLKGQIKRSTSKAEKENLEYLYAKSKNRLNSIFGMCYTDPVHDTIELVDGEWKSACADIDESLEKFYRSKNSFLNYQWGVWVTAHAREHLHKFSKRCCKNELYRDTDSCKGFDFDVNEVYKFNAEVIAQCEERGAYANDNGNRYYLGIFENETEKESYHEFKTLGAKKYCYTDSDGLHLTVSGVLKKVGVKELGTIDNFKEGFVFRKAGGVNLWYNDTNEIYSIVVDGTKIITSSNVGMLDGEYTLGITDEYRDLIGGLLNG